MVSTYGVCIGGSIGSFEPLKMILSGLHRELPSSVFVAIHINPRAERTLIGVLQKYCQLPMKYPVDEEYYSSSAVYVAPPGHHMLISYRKIWIFPANFVYLPKPNIDLLFQSAANEFGSRGIGVILSGGGNDGAIGIKAIKAKGGTTIVQSLDTAEATGMPQAAMDTNSVDYTVSPEIIPSIIERIAKGNLEDGENEELHLKNEINSYQSLNP